MAITKTTVTGPILDATGVAYQNATLIFTPAAVGGDDTADTVIAQSAVEVTPDETTGDFSASLAPSDTVHYTVTLSVRLEDMTKSYKIGLIYVPDTGPVALQDLLPIFAVNVPTNAELLAALSAAVASAEAAAVAAAASAALSPTYATRADYEAATVAASVTHFTVAGLRYVVDASGVAIESDNGVKGSPDGEYTPDHYPSGLDVLSDAAKNTLKIQAAVNDLNTIGGGALVIRKDYEVIASSEADSFYNIESDGSEGTRTASGKGCIVHRDNVTFEYHNGATISTADDTKSIILMLDIETGGGHVGVGPKGRVIGPSATSGAGHGILNVVTAVGQQTRGVRITNMEIGFVGSYGLGMQYGDFEDNQYSNLYIHDTGADAFDHKVRKGAKTTSRGVIISDVTCERFGQRSGIASSAGIDVRGPALLNNIWCLDYAVDQTHNGQPKVNAAVRLSSATVEDQDIRQASHYSVLTNFEFDGGDDSLQADGVVVLSSRGTKIGFGVTRGCTDNGVRFSNASSGVGDTSEFSSVSDVTVEGSRLAGVEVKSANVTLTNVSVLSQVQAFRQRTVDGEDRGNLEVGDTTLTTGRKFDTTTVVVEKNGTPLTLTTNYTVTDNLNIELVAAVIAADEFKVITPTPTGFDVDEPNCTMLGCSVDEYVTTAKAIDAAASDTFMEIGCRLGDRYMSLESGDVATAKVVGGGDFRVEVDAGEQFEVRVDGVNSFRVHGETSAVNWLQTRASATGSPVKLEATGTDTNVGIKFKTKGSGAINLGNIPTYADNAAAAADGRSVGDVYIRTGHGLDAVT